jgi:hypothetical protein
MELQERKHIKENNMRDITISEKERLPGGNFRRETLQETGDEAQGGR